MGTTVHDETGHADATFVGTCAPTTGALTGDSNSATLFADHCTFSAGTGLHFEGRAPYTVEFWIDSFLSSTQYTLMNEERNGTLSAPLQGYAVVIDVDGIYTERAVDGMLSGAPRVALPARFAHLVYTYDAPIADVRDLPAYTAELDVGGLPAMPAAAAQGSLDEVAIYDHALSQERITLHHDLGVNGPR